MSGPARRRAAGISGLLFCGGLAGIAAEALTLDYSVERALWLARGSGVLALALLLGALSVTPWLRLRALGGARSRPPIYAALRRALGLAAAAAGLVHLLLITQGGLWVGPEALILEPQLRSGAGALAILGLLAATSSPGPLQVRSWKSLHRLVYGAALLVLHHVYLSPLASPAWLAALAGTLLLSALLRVSQRSS